MFTGKRHSMQIGMETVAAYGEAWMRRKLRYERALHGHAGIERSMIDNQGRYNFRTMTSAGRDINWNFICVRGSFM